MPNESAVPTLPVYEGLSQWGEVRLTPRNLDNQITVELRRRGSGEVWKPMFTFLAIGGQIAIKAEVNRSGRTVIYDPRTNTFSEFAGTSQNGGSKT